ncbi:MAG: GntR family transcriptional regulator [Peptostreptococcaceae bacterium]
MKLYEKKHKETGKDYAYRVLKDNIMSIQLKPGDLLSESDLSQKLNISRTPIREVLMKLKSEHLIEVKPQSGTYISLIDWNLIEEAVFMRYTLEKEVLRQACESFPEDLVMELEKNIFAQSLIINKPDNDIEFHDLDKEFHKLLFLGTNKVHIWDSITSISTHYNRMRLLSEMKSNKEQIVNQHKVYLDMIKNKSVDGIENVIKGHIKSPIREWDAMIEGRDDLKYYIKNKK